MTKSEAITAVKEVTGMSLPWDDRHYEALQMAIAALEAQDVDGDTISRRAAIEAVGYYSLHSGDKLLFADKPLKELPSAQADLIAKIQDGIKATNANGVYSCGVRNGMRWCISLIDDKEPLYENCPPAQPKHDENPRSEQGESDKLGLKTGKTCTDCISRQAEIAALCKAGCNSEHCGVSCDDVRAIEELQSAQPEIIRCRDCRKHGKLDCPMGITVFDAPDHDGYCYKAKRKENR